MKYQLGDLIYSKGVGLGYITKITTSEDRLYYGSIFTIEWFINGSEHCYGQTDLDGYISKREAVHYPVGNQ
jgi:hypothetical protein